MVVIAGTGTVAAGRSPAGRTVRTLGLRRIYGDFGSATDVADEAVRAVADAYTGGRPATTLSRLLPPLAGCALASSYSSASAAGWCHYRRPPLVLAEAEAGNPGLPRDRAPGRSGLDSSDAVVARTSASASSASSWSGPVACSGAGAVYWRES
jgi:hypothetical protein